MNAIEITNISKTYTSAFRKTKVDALKNLNLAIPAGSIFGLLGPNGAGKTTLIKILLSICFPTSGTARILSEETGNYKLKYRIGYLPENHKFPSYLSGGEVLKFFGKLSGLEGQSLNKKIDELLELVKLNEWKKLKVKNYSKGMMQRLGIAQSLINDPELIFLDEPTDGVDPIGRKEIRDILSDLKSRNKTVFLNSHLLSEVEMISDRVAILNKGELIREGTVKELTEKQHEYSLELENPIDGDVYLNLASQFNFAQIKDGRYSALVKDLSELNGLIDALRVKKISIQEIIQKKSSLEEMFIGLINEAEKKENFMSNMLIISWYTLREAFARKVFIFFAVISVIFLVGLGIIFSLVNTDSILSSMNPSSDKIVLKEVISQIQLVITAPLSNLCLLLAIFSSASFVPIMLEKGNIDLLLSKPISRTQLLLGKYFGGILVVFINIAFLIIGTWIIISLKFSYWNFNFPLVILVITFTFAVLYSVVVLFGIMFRSSVPGMMTAYFIFLILSPALHFVKLQLQTFTGKEVLKSIVDGLYYFIPKTSELMGTINSNIGQGKAMGAIQPVLSSFLFLILTMFFCDYILKKKDF